MKRLERELWVLLHKNNFVFDKDVPSKVTLETSTKLKKLKYLLEKKINMDEIQCLLEEIESDIITLKKQQKET